MSSPLIQETLIQETQTIQVAGFISKTFQILNNEEFSKVIFWGPTGNEFVIKDTNKFQQVVLPRYFRHNKMNSFIRQLNMYGFHKSRADHSKSIFSHPSFLKNREDLLITIKRKIKEKTENVSDTPAETPPKSIIGEEISTNAAKQNPQTGLQLNSFNNISFPDLNLNKNISFRIYQKQRVQHVMNLNATLNRLPQNQMAELLYEDENDSDECLSIQQNMEAGQLIQMNENIKDHQNWFRFVNPSCFFDSLRKLL